MKTYRLSGVVCVATALLTACGGGGSDSTPRASVTSVKVMGDSLADVGTFGIKFTVQGTASKIYPERVAQSYGIATMCNFFAFNGTTFVANPTPGCSNFAIGGGVINGAGSGYAAADPRGISVQMQTAAAGGAYSAGDLFVIDGGGNDAAALVGAYLATATGGAPAITAYSTLLSTVLDPAVVATNLGAGASGFAAVGGLYMSALADRFHDQINTTVLGNGAQRVVLLNMPGITNTPRFQTVLASIAAANGGGTAGATARAQAEGLFKSWVEAFNSQLATRFAGNAKVALVDFYTAFNDQLANPGQYLLSNVTGTACPITGVGTDGLPTYSFPTCTDAALSAAPPAGVTDPNWWKSYAFSDSFHPTPYGHQLLAQLISRTLSRAGWL